MVFQHFMLADNLTVWENVVLGDEPGRFKIRISEARARLKELARQYGLEVDPDELTADLGVGERQRVEILKVLYRGARIIILDEPTAVLVPQEVDELFASLRELVAGGVTIIFISHKLNEVLAVADAITVIRAGRTVADVLPSEVTARQLAELMVGSELPSPATRTGEPGEEVALELRGVTVTEDGRPLLSDVDLQVHRGEIVGIAGVEGNGQDDLIDVILGIADARRRHGRARGARRDEAEHPAPAGGRPRLHPPGPPARRAGPHRPLVGERRTRSPDDAAFRPRRDHQPV